MHVNLARVEQFLFLFAGSIQQLLYRHLCEPADEEDGAGGTYQTLHQRVSCHISDDKSCKPQADY